MGGEIINIKVFGGSGFVGNHLIRRLLSLGHRVTVFDIKKPRIMGANVYRPEGGEASWYNPVHFAGGDITDYWHVYCAVDRGDYVVNLAAVAKYSDAEASPHTAASINVAGSANIAQACLENRAAHLIYTSTGSVYSPGARVPINEDEPTVPSSTYGRTKLWGENIHQSYLGRLPVAILRLPHIYGPGKFWGANTFIVKLLSGERPVIFGDGSTRNDFTHVEDVVQGIELALTKQASGVYNIGSGTSRTTKEFFEWSRRLLDAEHIQPVYAPPRDVDFPVFEYDISKAAKELGYRPKYNLEDGLRKTVLEWGQWI